MREIDPTELDHLDNAVGVVFGSLKYEPKRPEFHAARKALKRLGASYDWRLRVWLIPVRDDALDPLVKLYRRTTLALWVADAGEVITAESFDRYCD